MSTQRPRPDESTSDQTAGLTTQREARYSYLLRLWQSGAEANWCASLQSVRSGERHMFPDLETLFAFLIEHVRSSPEE
jgi:hypothetical protein